MDTLLLIILAGVGGMLVRSFMRPSQQPQSSSFQAEQQASAGICYLLPVIFVGFVLLLWFAGR
jgi:hypothetical protein